MKSVKIKSKVARGYKNSVSQARKDPMGRDAYLLNLMKIFRERYSIDGDDLERFIKLYRDTGRE